jgi:nicotinamidase-related amidase
VLRAQGVRKLVLTGIATSGAVLSTLREAADRDFDLTVLAGGCLDNDPEVHASSPERSSRRELAEFEGA